MYQIRGKLKPNLMAEQRRKKFLHSLGKERMAAIILVRLPYRNQRGSRALPARSPDDDDLAGLCQIRCESADQCEFESSRSRA